jgi:hypothetical protein
MPTTSRSTSSARWFVRVLLLPAMVGCGGGGLQGTYHHPQGAFVLELSDGDQAVVQIFGQSVRCTYNVEKAEVQIACPAEASMVQAMLGTLARNKDGTLSSASGVLSKRESS